MSSVVRFGVTPKMKPVPPRRAAVVAALDVGTSKIVCMIARLEPQAPQEVLRSHGVRVLGFAHTAASGMKGGGVVDLVEAEQMIRNAIEIAETAAQVQLQSVVVSLSGGRLGSERFIADIALSGGAVGDSDIARVIPCVTAAPSCTPCRSASSSTPRTASANRAACSAAVSALICTW